MKMMTLLMEKTSDRVTLEEFPSKKIKVKNKR